MRAGIILIGLLLLFGSSAARTQEQSAPIATMTKSAAAAPAEMPVLEALAAKMAGAASRFNTMLSIPMLYCMASFSHGGF